MPDNFQVWPKIADLVDNRYYVTRKDGSVEEDIETREAVRRKMLALRQFFYENGLLSVDIRDARGAMIDRAYCKNDFTDEGLALLRSKGDNWLVSKGSSNDPPSMKILEKALSAMRQG